MTWTDERVDQLKKLWAQGYSASQIAKDLGSTTRNAVIGKIHRLNLVARQTAKNTPPLLSGTVTAFAAGKTKAAAVKTPVAKTNMYAASTGNNAYWEAAPKPASFNAAFYSQSASSNPFIDDVAIKPVAHNPFANTRAQCQWPVGDPRQSGFHFCGASAQEGCSYCGEHMRLAYQPVARKRFGLGNTDVHTTGTPDEREIAVRF